MPGHGLATGTGSIATGGEFTNAIIPLAHPAVSQVARNVLNLWPRQPVTGPLNASEDTAVPNATGVGTLEDEADLFTVKVEHKFSNRSSLSGMWLYNNTDEPGSSLMPQESWFMADQSEFFGPLRRRPKLLVFNSTNVLNDTTVLTGRFGWQSFKDQQDKQVFSPGLGSLGFSDTFVRSIAEPDSFPAFNFNEVEDIGGFGGDRRIWKGPWAFNASLTKLMGSHSLKVGFDSRKMVIKTTTVSAISGSFDFDPRFTSAPGVANSGHDLATFLLGLPSSGSVASDRGSGVWFLKYYAGFAQDEWRVNSKLTVNFGSRFEHEDGLKEEDNRQTVGFDRDAVNPIDALVPKAGTPLEGRTLGGGLLFAGVNGAPEEQGDPLNLKVGPRASATYALNDRTVLRGGFGLFWAPWQFNAVQHGQNTFRRTTSVNQSTPQSEVPLTTIDDPFPQGLLSPTGASLGLLSGVGGSLDVIDQDKGSPRVFQYSADVQIELPFLRNAALTVGYQGATGRDLGFGGTNNAAININQIDPDLARQLFPAPGGGWDPAKLLESIPNPFFGIAQAGEFGRRATIQRGQLLRPFPQFGNINVFERTDGGKRQFHSAIAMLEKRTGAAGRFSWGGRLSYAWSYNKDNQFCETSTFQNRTCEPQNNLDLEAENSRSNFDSPHRIILAPVAILPEPQNGFARHLLGGWMASAIVELVSGSPLNPTISASRSAQNLGLFGGQQRPDVLNTDASTPGSDADRVAAADTPTARFFDRNAFQNPGPGRFGNAPRTLGSTRHQFRKNVDLVLVKRTRLGGARFAEIRIEGLNLLNETKFRGAPNNVDLASFGRITSQAGFRRITQISFRYTF